MNSPGSERPLAWPNYDLGNRYAFRLQFGVRSSSRRSKALLQPLVRSRVLCAGEGLGNGALHLLPAQDEASESPPGESSLTSAWISLTQNPCFLMSPLDRWGQFRPGVQLCFARRGTPVATVRDTDQSHLSQRAGGLN